MGQQLPDARQCIVNTGIGYTWVGPGDSLNPVRWEFTLKMYLKAIFTAFCKISESLRGKKSETELASGVLKNDQKHKMLKKQNQKKNTFSSEKTRQNANFRRNPLFECYEQVESSNPTVAWKVPTNCTEA